VKGKEESHYVPKERGEGLPREETIQTTDAKYHCASAGKKNHAILSAKKRAYEQILYIMEKGEKKDIMQKS